MNTSASDLCIFLHDPDPWGNNANTRPPQSILPLGSARNCRQTLAALDQPDTFYPPENGQEKTYALHGNVAAHKKYTAIIECQDAYPPAYDDLWPQRVLWIYSAVRMMVLHHPGTSGVLSRIPVPKTFIFHNKHGEEKPLPDMVWDNETKKITWGQAGFISYTPILKMGVQSMTLCAKEWEASSTWKLHLKEV
jgi:hypothetical protein